MKPLKPQTAKPIPQMTKVFLLCKNADSPHRHRARCREPCDLAGLPQFPLQFH
ncbi:hypothetical protein Lcho_3099 [Leptothrix cholodnii SP-6]|uniref:Uncharacterized protein n=1 Tax=Leptothrix cholodnii (strain ATCC 51168 / LMG 8142 / SP-6) TaxID=395495 RepID=B1Y078_LEPCP|nr:hypothetical protein Lcho_3099 [Leptothrix cholodnii SP-6]